MSKYTCITIGPIVATLMKARKTKELWAASYLFSLIMRRIVSALAGKKGENQENIVIPYRKEKLIHQEWWRDFIEMQTNVKDDLGQKAESEKIDPGVGLYLDHIVYRGEIDNLEEIKQEVFREVADLLYTRGKKQNDIIEFLQNYIQIYYFVIEENTANFMQRINRVFDVLELQVKISQEGAYSLKDFFKELPETTLYKCCFKNNNYLGDHCKSIVEIATAELPVKPEVCVSEDEEDRYIAECRANNKELFFNYHKYYAVVQSDGDRMSHFIKKVIGCGLSVQDVSEALFNWAKKSVREVLKFGGLPVYAGGDDLLFFAPVNNEQTSLIAVLENINEIFKTEVTALLDGRKMESDFRKPSLSFGVAVAYYKYPLNEACDRAYGLLKEMKTMGGDGIRLKLIKHSNSDFDTVLRFRTEDVFYHAFKEMIQIPAKEISDTEIRGITRRLREDKKVLEVLARRIDLLARNEEMNELYKRRIVAYFKNCVEDYTETNKLLNLIVELLQVMPEEIWNDSGYYEKIRDIVYSFEAKPVNLRKSYSLLIFDMLRVIKFFKGIEEIK